MAVIEGARCGRLLFNICIWLPHLNARVQVAHTSVAAPLNDDNRINVPCKIQQDVSGGEPFTEEARKVLARHRRLFIRNASGDRIRNSVARVEHLNHANAGRRNLHVTNEEWNDRLTDGATAEHDHPRGAGGARGNERVVYRHKGAILPPAPRACEHA